MAARFGHTRVMRTLAEAGADLLKVDLNGLNALHVAVKYNKLGVIEMLL